MKKSLGTRLPASHCHQEVGQSRSVHPKQRSIPSIPGPPILLRHLQRPSFSGRSTNSFLLHRCRPRILFFCTIDTPEPSNPPIALLILRPGTSPPGTSIPNLTGRAESRAAVPSPLLSSPSKQSHLAANSPPPSTDLHDHEPTNGITRPRLSTQQPPVRTRRPRFPSQTARAQTDSSPRAPIVLPIFRHRLIHGCMSSPLSTFSALNTVNTYAISLPSSTLACASVRPLLHNLSTHLSFVSLTCSAG